MSVISAGDAVRFIRNEYPYSNVKLVDVADVMYKRQLLKHTPTIQSNKLLIDNGLDVLVKELRANGKLLDTHMRSKPKQPKVSKPKINRVSHGIEPLVNRIATSKLLGCSTRHLDNLTMIGEIIPTRIGGRVMFQPAEIRRFIESKTQVVQTQLQSGAIDL